MPEENIGKVDISFICVNPKCGADDVWEVGEQKFMLKLKAEGKIEGDIKMPRYCRDCRAERREKKERDNNRPADAPRY